MDKGEIWEVLRDDCTDGGSVFEGTVTGVANFLKGLPRNSKQFYSVALTRDEFSVKEWLEKYNG